MMDWWPGAGMTGWGWVAMTISMVLFWAVLIMGGVWLVRVLGRSSGAPSTAAGSATPRPTPEELLADRFARGEIDEDEYRRRLAALRASSAELTGSR